MTGTVDPSRCFVLVPVARYVEPATETRLQELEKRGYPVRRIYGYPVDVARNRLVSAALDEGAEEIMWIDADMVFNPDDVDRLRAHPNQVIGGAYAKRGGRALCLYTLPGTTRFTLGDGGGLEPVLYTGTGFLLVRRAVFEDIRSAQALPVCNQRSGQAIVPYFMPMVIPDGDGHWYLQDDFAFCERARRAGHDIWVDTQPRVWHVGSYWFGWEDAGRDVERFATYHMDFD